MSALDRLNQRSYGHHLDSPHRPTLGDLRSASDGLLRPPRRMHRRDSAHDDTAQVRAALDDVFDEVQELCHWGWPSSWSEDHERQACQAVVDAAAYLLGHRDPTLADLLAVIQPILDAYWPARRWTMHRAHEAVERLRIAVAAASYGRDRELTDRQPLRCAA